MLFLAHFNFQYFKFPQYDLVCDKDIYPTLGLVALNVGGPIGVYLFGMLNDRYGRRFSYFTCLATLLFGSFITAFSTDFGMWAFSRIIVGLTIPAVYQIPFIIGKTSSVNSIYQYDYPSFPPYLPFHLSTFFLCAYSIRACRTELSLLCHRYDVHILHIWPHGLSISYCLRSRLVHLELSHVRALPLLLPLHLHHAREPAMAPRQGKTRGCSQNTRNNGTSQRQGLPGELSQ